MTRQAGYRAPVVFGAADGVTALIGLSVPLAAAAPGQVFRTALGVGLAELVGMTAGQWLSDSGSGFRPALANGAASLAGCAVPALPYLLWHGAAALVPAIALVLAAAAAISWLRPERGFLAVAQTYGVLAAAAALCAIAALA